MAITRSGADSTNKPVISVGQALLILIDHHRADTDTCDDLKQLYLSGATSTAEREAIEECMHDPILDGYTISGKMNDINEDPTRRYFETHLALATLKTSLDELDSNSLQQHFRLLKICLADKLTDSETTLANHILDGNTDQVDGEDKEFADAIHKLKSSDFYTTFSQPNKDKLILLVKQTFLCLVMVNCYDLPIDIYRLSYFADANRGRARKPEQDAVRSHHFGLMKSHMPVPKDDAAYSDTAFPYLRCADRREPIPNAAWPVHNASQLVHPFSNSISGTILVQLRVFKCFATQKVLAFDDKLKLMGFLKNYIALFVYNSGGHSLYEYTAVLANPRVRKAFAFIPGFNDINLESLFYKGNKVAFDKAIEATIGYNKQIIKRAAVQAEVRTTELTRRMR